MINSQLDQASVYTEFSGLNALKSQAREDKTEALKAVTKQFESMFLSLITKSMRDANKVFSEGNMMNSNETEFYQQMFDSQMSLTLSEGKGVGLADTMMRQMSRQINGIEQGESTNPLSVHNIADYPRTLKTQKQVSEAIELADSLIRVEDTINRTSQSSRSEIGSSDPISSDSQGVLGEKADGATSIAPLTFASPDEYITHLYPVALKVEEETGINAKVMLAQSALETGWGKHMVTGSDSEPSFNLFGIKADQRWGGDSVVITTTEYRDGVAMKEKAAFRSYEDYEESFRDYAAFLKQNPRYSNVMNYLDDPEQFTRSLQEAGYATDPAYSNKIQRILGGDIFKGALNTNAGSDSVSFNGSASDQNNVKRSNYVQQSADSLAAKAVL